jgi:hypothetical protein
VIFGLKIIGHGNLHSNLESSCTITISFKIINAPYLEVNYLAVEKRVIKLPRNQDVTDCNKYNCCYYSIIPTRTMSKNIFFYSEKKKCEYKEKRPRQCPSGSHSITAANLRFLIYILNYL